MNDVPEDMMEKLRVVMSEAWHSPSSMFVDVNKCQSCDDHWHVMICPSVRELMGGPRDGEQVFERFVLNVNKVKRAFDKRPKVFFDTSYGESVPHMIFAGKINGHSCDVAIMSHPPSNLIPLERVYVSGPKKGTVEDVDMKQEE